MTQFIVVVGSLLNGVSDVFGPFNDESAARQWAIGSGDEDRFEEWFSMEMSEPGEEEEEE